MSGNPREARRLADESEERVVLDALVPNPEKEAEPLSDEERSDYRVIGWTMVALSSLVVFIMVVYGPAAGWTPWAEAIFSIILLSFLMPIAVSLLTLKKIFLALGLIAFGLLAILIAMILFIKSPIELIFAPSALGILFGILCLPLAYRLIKLKHPFYGLR